MSGQPLPSSIPSQKPASSPGQFLPPPINKVEDTGLAILWLQDLALKILYFQGYFNWLQNCRSYGAPVRWYC